MNTYGRCVLWKFCASDTDTYILLLRNCSDLKLENFLFSDEAADSELKMIDFGLSKVRVYLIQEPQMPYRNYTSKTPMFYFVAFHIWGSTA